MPIDSLLFQEGWGTVVCNPTKSADSTSAAKHVTHLFFFWGGGSDMLAQQSMCFLVLSHTCPHVGAAACRIAAPLFRATDARLDYALLGDDSAGNIVVDVPWVRSCRFSGKGERGTTCLPLCVLQPALALALAITLKLLAASHSLSSSSLPPLPVFIDSLSLPLLLPRQARELPSWMPTSPQTQSLEVPPPVVGGDAAPVPVWPVGAAKTCLTSWRGSLV